MVLRSFSRLLYLRFIDDNGLVKRLPLIVPILSYEWG